MSATTKTAVPVRRRPASEAHRAAVSEFALSFKAAVIPHTWEHTTLKDLRPGSVMNIEYDILGKYASARPSKGITAEFLKENGFL